MKTKLLSTIFAIFCAIGINKAQCTMTIAPTVVYGTPGSYAIGATGPMYIQVCANVIVYDTMGSNQRKYYLLPGASVVFRGGFNNFAFMQGNSSYTRLGTNGAMNFVYKELTATVTGTLTQTNTCTAVSFPTIACTSTGIHEYSQTDLLKVYPNPATGFVNITNDHSVELTGFITNSVGQLVRTVVLSKGKNTIDLYDLNEGIYFINISEKDKVIGRGKIMVTK